MKRFKLSLLFISIMIFSIGCAGAGDYLIELTDDYVIIRSSAHTVTISTQMSDGVFESTIVPPKVTEVGWNEDYILAKQLGLKPDPNRNNGYRIPDPDNARYWIINVSTNEKLGSFNEQEFIDKKESLGIPEDVVLKPVSQYR